MGGEVLVDVHLLNMGGSYFNRRGECLRKKSQIEARTTRELHGVGSRVQLKDPGPGSRAKHMTGFRRRSLQKLQGFTAFSMQNTV